ncbi:class I SAM-dependent DNA methyltransferase [Kordiimonas aquimaris]|uniref:class I SAM-dependent DNA methyltransferase n=1 Tax=Kordiimonas aquimaris TaxID=707591 RepID=UPI0021D151BC|nr:class I SAM-dependent methyltransferase [Kordiimonas aquimaris]
MDNLEATLATKTQGIYNRHGQQFDTERSKSLFERKWLKRFEALIKPKAHILDAGCGAGEPIAQYFIEKGHELTGVDFSNTMINIAKQRFPQNDWHILDMRELQFDKRFDGIIGWHSFFHLTANDQRTTLNRFAVHLVNGGALMLTVGPKSGEEVGHVCGDQIYHASLSPKEYSDILQTHNMQIVEFVAEDPECDYATVLLAQKSNT